MKVNIAYGLISLFIKIFFSVLHLFNPLRVLSAKDSVMSKSQIRVLGKGDGCIFCMVIKGIIQLSVRASLQHLLTPSSQKSLLIFGFSSTILAI